ncbi:hypothetical protein TNCV_2421831 [Trichonephila clavipes]|nr:hypothetical protein TNCV_2421831 [Trichonephila clavipes]
MRTPSDCPRNSEPRTSDQEDIRVVTPPLKLTHHINVRSLNFDGLNMHLNKSYTSMTLINRHAFTRVAFKCESNEQSSKGICIRTIDLTVTSPTFSFMIVPTSTESKSYIYAALESYTRAIADGPRNIESSSSDNDDT